MEPVNNRFGGGVSSTVLFPWVAVVLLVAIVLILFLPRKYAIVPLLLVTFLVPVMGQVVVVGGLHFTITRILALFGCVRLLSSKVLSRASLLPGGFNSVDRAFLFCAVFGALSFSLVWMEWQALINQLAIALDALGAYFFLRFLIRDREDVRRTIKVLALISVVTAVAMIREHLTHQNLFWQGTVMGTSSVREGSIRAQGAFEVYLLAGAFGATLVPLLIWLWCEGSSKVIASLGMVGASIMTFTTGSSTPLSGYAAGILGLCLWPLRKRMRLIRWGLVVALVALDLVMKAPVWALISRVDFTGSSSSYHRYMLVDNCIRHFNDWWLLGAKDYNTWGWDMWDTSNQYVSYALKGGLVTLCMFILVISRSFGRLGTAMKRVHQRRSEWLLWCLGAALFSHVVGFFGVGYDSQMQVAWCALLAIVSVATSEAIGHDPVQIHVQVPAVASTSPQLPISVGTELHIS